MANWVFWLMFVIIVILITYILIRDEKSREFVKRIFSWISKKIRIAKIKSRIGKEEEKKRNRQKELGEKAFVENLDCIGAQGCKNEIINLKAREENLNADLEEIDRKLKVLQDDFGHFEKGQQGILKELNGELNPLKEKEKQEGKEFNELEREKREKSGTIGKNERRISSEQDKIARVREDMSLSSQEKKAKEDEMLAKINQYQDESAKCRNRIEIIDLKLGELQKTDHQSNSRITSL